MKRLLLLILALLLCSVLSLPMQASGWWFSGSAPQTPDSSFWFTSPTPSRGTSTPQWQFSSPSQPSTPPVTSDPITPIQPQPSPPSTPTQPQPSPSTPLQPQPRNIPYPSSQLDSGESRLIALVNEERRAHGLSPLAVDMRLVELAKEKSWDMATHRYFAHYSPRLGTIYQMLGAANYSYIRAGENIARAVSVDNSHALFMGSSGHRANVLASGYTHMGVGIVRWGTIYYVTQVFVRR